MRRGEREGGSQRCGKKGRWVGGREGGFMKG